MIRVSLEPKWRHFAQVNIADIFMLSSKLPKQNEKIGNEEEWIEMQKKHGKMQVFFPYAILVFRIV